MCELPEGDSWGELNVVGSPGGDASRSDKQSPARLEVVEIVSVVWVRRAQVLLVSRARGRILKTTGAEPVDFQLAIDPMDMMVHSARLVSVKCLRRFSTAVIEECGDCQRSASRKVRK